MKKPYLDLWSYVNSLAPEVYVGEEINHQTWVDLSNLQSETYAGVPGQFIKYFAGKDEVEARLGAGTRWFTRIVPGGHERLNTILRTGKYSKLQELQAEDWSFLSNLGNQGCGETVSIVQEYSFRGTYLPGEEELLREVAEEMRKIGLRIRFKARYDCCDRWGDERTQGTVYPAPFGIPLVFESNSRDLVLSEYKHRQAEKRMLARATTKKSTIRSNQTLERLNTLISSIGTILTSSPASTYDGSIAFFKPMIPKSYIKLTYQFGEYFGKNTIQDLAGTYSHELAEYWIKTKSTRQIAALFKSRRWQNWWKKLMKAVVAYEDAYAKTGSKMLSRNARKHAQFAINSLSRHSRIDSLRILWYAAKLPGWETLKALFVRSGLDKA